jgi:hypothetical protein
VAVRTDGVVVQPHRGSPGRGPPRGSAPPAIAGPAIATRDIDVGLGRAVARVLAARRRVAFDVNREIGVVVVAALAL